MIKICNINGIPRTIQTKTFEMFLMSLNLLIEQKAIGSPSGIPHINVTAKINNDILKPSSKNIVTSKNDILSTPKNVAGFKTCHKNHYVFTNYFWSEKSLIAVFSTSYFFANSSIVPSAASFSSSAFTFAVNSLPFLKPIA